MCYYSITISCNNVVIVIHKGCLQTYIMLGGFLAQNINFIHCLIARNYALARKKSVYSSNIV